MKILSYSLLALLIGVTTQSFAETTAQKITPPPITVSMYATTAQGIGQLMGTVTISENPYGLLFTPHLSGLPVSPHGFHIHTTPSCEMKGMAANGHLDPININKHLGPYGSGHLGDLPALYVNADGTATIPVLAPRLKDLATVRNHALMIHEGGDNYSDTPEKLGGGGGRMICGVIPA